MTISIIRKPFAVRILRDSDGMILAWDARDRGEVWKNNEKLNHPDTEYFYTDKIDDIIDLLVPIPFCEAYPRLNFESCVYLNQMDAIFKVISEDTVFYYYRYNNRYTKYSEDMFKTIFTYPIYL